MKKHYFIIALLAMLFSSIYSFAQDPDEGELIEIPQNQGIGLDGFQRTTLEEGTNYNTYTANGDLQIAIKMMNVDVANCDYVVIKFAEPVAAGWKLAFWSGQDLTDVPAGATEYKYVFAEDPKCGVSEGVLPQICMMTFFGGYTAPLVAKVTGLYKHVTSDTPEQIAAKQLAAAKATKNAVINSYVVGDGLFMTTQAQKDAALAAVASAATVEAIEAVALPTVKAPEAGKAYAIKNATVDGYLTIGEKVEVADMAPIYFTAVEGGYVLSNGEKYLCKSGESWNGWSVSETDDVNAAYKVTFALNDGKYLIHGANGDLGLDYTTKNNGDKTVYADKNAAQDGLWTIEDYVAPVVQIQEVTYVHSGSVSWSSADPEKDVTYVRTFASINQWQSLFVPFTIDASKMAEQGVILAEITSIEKSGDDVVVSIKKVTEGIIPAKTPLLMAVTSSYNGSVKTGVSKIQSRLNGKTEYSAATVTGYLITEQKTGIEGSYVMSGGLLRKVENAEAALPKNHWYITLKDASAGAKVRIAGVEDEVSSMDKTFDFVIKTPPAAVTVNGTTVDPSTLNSGDIYIQNGKKYIVK